MTASQLAFVFPGQGSQSQGMLGDLAARHPVIIETFAEASEGAGVDLWTLSQQGPEAQLNQTEFTQPALLAAGVAVWRAWQRQNGATPAVLAGHSLSCIWSYLRLLFLCCVCAMSTAPTALRRRG